ncbi:hypothetical protein TNCV_4111651 [Trichonephila clavipes]|nr:hypothetical protein TNCV_4111651 [Trichonephila clavipes]
MIALLVGCNYTCCSPCSLAPRIIDTTDTVVATPLATVARLSSSRTCDPRCRVVLSTRGTKETACTGANGIYIYCGQSSHFDMMGKFREGRFGQVSFSSLDNGSEL